ncbi:MAG: hypothetical protein LUG16_05640 [Candidatus Gastranaerophilales bacterium]|nr:hypothetical protein [Candidatus Gastranaerophilales bacterium]
MKKFLMVLIFLAVPVWCYAEELYTCPEININLYENESFYNKITGRNFLAKKITEIAIQKEIQDELQAKTKAQIEMYNVRRMKNGEFKRLSIEGSNLKYKVMSLSSFSAQTICPYNRAIYKNGRLFYPYDMPFKFDSEITNNDIKNILESEEFQKELNSNVLLINGAEGLKILQPEVEIKENRVYFTIPIKTFLTSKPVKVRFNADIKDENNKIVLKNIAFSSNRNIIERGLLSNLTEKINPISFPAEKLKGKYCKIYISNARIDGSVIKAEGIFIINKNYNGDE